MRTATRYAPLTFDTEKGFNVLTLLLEYKTEFEKTFSNAQWPLSTRSQNGLNLKGPYMKSGLFLFQLRPQYHVLKPQLHYLNVIIPKEENICYTCQHLSDHTILKTNMVAAEPTSHPLLNTSCVGATRPQQLSGALSEQFGVTARLPMTTRQPDRSNIDLPIIPRGLGASQ